MSLDGIQMQDGGLSHIVQSPVMKSLEHLSIGDNNITDLGIKMIAESSYMANIRILALNENRAITDKGITCITSSLYLKQIEVLNLCSAAITGRSLSLIAASENMVNLNKLFLGGITFDEKEETFSGINALAESTNMSCLKVFDLSYYKTSNPQKRPKQWSFLNWETIGNRFERLKRIR